MVAVDVEERPGRGVEVRLASAADENLLYELYGDRIQMSEELVYNADKERVERVERIAIGSIVLEETRSAAPPSEASAAGVARRGAARAPTSSPKGTRSAV